jgi:hypothetical protein
MYPMTELNGRPIAGRSEPPVEFAREFRELLHRFGYDDSFGLYLLHRHWALTDEVLMERPISASSAEVVAISRADVKDAMVPVLWKATAEGWETLQWCSGH